jgi:DNA-binding NarL/FixJ family response regulator
MHYYRLAIVDDSDFIRSTFKKHFHIEKQVNCVKAYYNMQSFISDLTNGLALDILVLDINLFGVSSLNDIPAIRKAAPNLKIYTAYEDPDFLLKSLRLGVSGYLLKTNSMQELEADLLDFLKGDIKISGKMAHKLSIYLRQNNSKTDEGMAMLTPREGDVLKLLAEGYAYDEIGERIGIATNSVRTHIKGIYRKLQVNNSVQAAKRYLDSQDLIIENEQQRLGKSAQ